MPGPCEGTLRILRDVEVERLQGDRLAVISRHAGFVGQLLTIELVDAPADPFDVCVTESRPSVVDGTVRHRLHLQLVHGDKPEAPGVFLSEAGPRLGVLAQHVPVRILNCSSAGCLLEADTSLEVGLVGSLRLRIGDQEMADDLKIVRCFSLPGSSSCRIGADFLWITPVGRQSLRRAVSHQATSQWHGLGS
ncbi:MAG TPA: hypothetical protein VJM31_02545 [Vicinamibacterales bacterium]|nr:hypothetical protein [Vicinamibacterales bacterium]